MNVYLLILAPIRWGSVWPGSGQPTGHVDDDITAVRLGRFPLLSRLVRNTGASSFPKSHQPRIRSLWVAPVSMDFDSLLLKPALR